MKPGRSDEGRREVRMFDVLFTRLSASSHGSPAILRPQHKPGGIMRVALRNPIVGKLGEEFDRVFDRLLVPRFLTEPLVPPFPFECTGAEWIPVMDMIETAEEYVVRLEVPGFHKENLDINLTGELLTVTGKREIAPEFEGEGYLARERAIGKFVRTIRLPAPVVEEKVTAEYRDGMLVLHLPKEIAAPATKILIK